MELPPNTETLTLYALRYHIGEKEIKKDTPAHLTFLYARHDADAEIKAKEAVRMLGIHMGCEIYKEELTSCPGGFTVWRTQLPGKIQAKVGDPRYK